MITKISLNKVASYKKPTVLETDKKVNLIYGLNGTGKSTLSDYLLKSSDSKFKDCAIEGLSNDDEILVYNQSFIRENFFESESLNRNFKAETINQKWVTDITYIHVLKEGWTYLASVMDLYDRKIIGYSYGKSMTADLALDAVKNACLNVSDTNGIILHSDLGSQYTSDLFEEYMRTNGFIHSFSRKGNMSQGTL